MRQSQAQDIIELISGQVLTMVTDTLVKQFRMTINGYKVGCVFV